jgi:hypothetical protein
MVENYFFGRIVAVNGTVAADGTASTTLSYDCEAVQTKTSYALTNAIPRNRPQGVNKIVASKLGDPVLMVVCPSGVACDANEFIISLTETLKFEDCP